MRLELEQSRAEPRATRERGFQRFRFICPRLLIGRRELAERGAAWRGVGWRGLGWRWTEGVSCRTMLQSSS